MDCPSCKDQNPEHNQFCGKCGAALYPATDVVSQRVERIVNERFKDRALIEHEVSDKLVARFMTMFKFAGMVFTAAFAALGITVTILGFMGIKTYSDAAKAIQVAGNAAVSELHASALKSQEAIAASVKGAQEKIEAYATPLKKSAESMEAQNKIVSGRVAAVSRSAEENEQKLAKLSAVRSSYPTLAIGDISSALVSPSMPFTISRLREYRIGSSGPEVKQIQSRLKELDCYAGEATGEYDAATAEGVIAYKKAQGVVPAISGAALGTIADTSLRLALEGTSDGVIRESDWSQLIYLGPTLNMSGTRRCPK